jgi:hypothetical protein
MIPQSSGLLFSSLCSFVQKLTYDWMDVAGITSIKIRCNTIVCITTAAVWA